MFTLTGYVSNIGSFFAELTLFINGTIEWSPSTFLDDITIQYQPNRTFANPMELVNISNCISLSGATYQTGSYGYQWFTNSGAVGVNMQIKVPLPYIDGLSNPTCTIDCTCGKRMGSLGIGGVFYENCSNLIDESWYIDTEISDFDVKSPNTEAQSGYTEEEKQHNAILVYNMLRGETAVHKWSISSISCICALMDCQSNFNFKRVMTRPYPRISSDTWRNYGQLPALEGTYVITKNDPTFEWNGNNEYLDITQYYGVIGFPFFNRCYLWNYERIDPLGIYSDKIFTLEQTVQMWEYERRFTPPNWCNIWKEDNVYPYTLNQFSTSNDAPENCVTSMYYHLNKTGTTEFPNQWGSEYQSIFDNWASAVEYGWGLPCLIQKARYWYDFFKSIQPKKHKMPIWEYLRYTI